MLTLMLHTYSPGYSKGKTVAFNTSKALLVVYPLGKLIGLLLVINISLLPSPPLRVMYFGSELQRTLPSLLSITGFEHRGIYNYSIPNAMPSIMLS